MTEPAAAGPAARPRHLPSPRPPSPLTTPWPVNPVCIPSSTASARRGLQIKYKVETEDAEVETELPFVMGVMGDFTGQPDPDNPLPALKDRKFVEIDRDNFDDVLAGMAPRAAFKVDDKLSGEEDKQLNVELKFKSLDDFSPENVAPADRADEKAAGHPREADGPARQAGGQRQARRAAAGGAGELRGPRGRRQGPRPERRPASPPTAPATADPAPVHFFLPATSRHRPRWPPRRPPPPGPPNRPPKPRPAACWTASSIRASSPRMKKNAAAPGRWWRSSSRPS